MKNTGVFLLSFLFSISLYSQGESIFSDANHKAITSFLEEKPSKLSKDEFRMMFHIPIGKSDVTNSSDISVLYTNEIKEINLYYSDYPKNQDFDLLNIKRIEQLFSLIDLSVLPKFKWNIIKQTKCNNYLEASKLFHGFEVIMKFDDGKDLDAYSFGDFKINEQFKDFVVENVLKRNNWEDMLVAMDLTGSMSPYAAQLFAWLGLNTADQKVKQFVFFNDGDFKKDSEKVIGETGGIYHTKSKIYDEIVEVALKTIMSGYGGDAIENDIEALLAGIRLCPNCKDLILIADNSCKMRDFELLSQIDQPIRVILCGIDFSKIWINPEYLTLARDTGGSVHTIEEDIFNLMELNEGETITIGAHTFIIQDNKFVEVKKG